MIKRNEKISYSIILPVYNEEKGVELTINQLLKYIKKESCELVVVNDGSTDNTKKILEKFKDHDNLRCITHEYNKGYGAALKTGISKSKFDVIVITDSDGTYPNDEIPKLIDMLEEDCSMVVGARTGLSVKIPIIRKPAKYILNILANYLANTKIPDLNSGLRVIRKEVLNRFINILPNTFSFTTTLTLATLTNNMRVIFTPIDYHQRKGKSKFRPIKDTLNFIQSIVRTILLFNPLRIFIPFSAILFFLGLIVFLFSVFYLPYSLEITGAILISTSIIVLAVGMLADLIDRRLGL